MNGVLPIEAKARDVEAVVDALRQLPELPHAVSNATTWYSCLPYCILAAIFSINARYSTILAMLHRYRDHYGFPPIEVTELPADIHEPTVSELIGQVQDTGGPQAFAATVLGNRMRTSTRNGILKAEAAYQFAHVLAARRLERKRDVFSLLTDHDEDLADLEQALRAIPGQRSGIAVDYFFMNVGDPMRIKSDRRVLQFLSRALHRSVGTSEALGLLVAASDSLCSDHPGLTPRALDRLIWVYETGWVTDGAPVDDEASRLERQIRLTERRLEMLRSRLAALRSKSP